MSGFAEMHTVISNMMGKDFLVVVIEFVFMPFFGGGLGFFCVFFMFLLKVWEVCIKLLCAVF